MRFTPLSLGAFSTVSPRRRPPPPASNPPPSQDVLPRLLVMNPPPSTSPNPLPLPSPHHRRASNPPPLAPNPPLSLFFLSQVTRAGLSKTVPVRRFRG
ncbi:hypothetical protein Acr_08g0011360 [Actinidia rufa]|uniref:Uncharacterized protein n=1 Tax=Actinidia rufa TaxID=165716 RepID=A0A7J0F255_9ERIC|nr:hypothetical protein Acr_08g0011360 [Actinidia rufa]